jgi:hypothetical protein
MVRLGMNFCTNFVPPIRQSAFLALLAERKINNLRVITTPWSSIPSLATIHSVQQNCCARGEREARGAQPPQKSPQPEKARRRRFDSVPGGNK